MDRKNEKGIRLLNKKSPPKRQPDASREEKRSDEKK